MRAIFGAALVAGAPMLTSIAHAQIASSRSGTSSVEVVDAGESRRSLIAFGNCFARRYPDQVLALMATVPGSRAETETYRRVFRRRAGVCLNGDRVRMPRWIGRGTVVEGLYRLGVEVPASLRQNAPAPGTARNVAEAALCYAAGHGDRVRALIADSRAFSPEEREAVSAMREDFFRCLSPSTGLQRVNSTLLRYRLVEALMRLRPSAAPSAAPGN